MKNALYSILALFLTLAISSTARAQDFSELDTSPLDIAYYPPRAAFRTLAGTDAEREANQPVIRVLYSRPQKKGRDVFGSLVPYDKVWRAGANESSEILFFKPVEIGGTELQAGRYTFYIVPMQKEWKILFSSDLDNWGAYAYDPDKDVASVTVPTETKSKSIEAFSIAFEETEDGANMLMGWDKTVVRVPINFEK